MTLFIVYLLGYCAAAYFYEENHDDIKVTHGQALVTLICWPYVLYVEVKKWRLK